MSQTFRMKVQQIDHYGIVGAILQKTDLINRIDKVLLDKKRFHKLTHGEAIAGLIVSGLGFTDNRERDQKV